MINTAILVPHPRFLRGVYLLRDHLPPTRPFLTTANRSLRTHLLLVLPNPKTGGNGASR